MQLDGLPGGERIARGLRDLAEGRETEEALLVAIGGPRLRRLGFPVPSVPLAEHRLYLLLARADPDGAHSRYNALIRRLVSFERAAECCGLTDPEKLAAFLRRLGEEVREEGRVYLTGGATALLLGWRSSTIDVDLFLDAGAEAALRAIPRLKEELEINVELAAPSDFIPELPGWRERSLFVRREGRLEIFHYDPYSQALAKLERAHAMDLEDVREMLARGLVDPALLRDLFAAVEPLLYRYPAVDPAGFRRRVEEAASGRGAAP